MNNPDDEDELERIARMMREPPSPEERAFFNALSSQPGSVGLDQEGRLQICAADGTWADVVQIKEPLGDLVVARGSGDRLLLLMGFGTRDDGEPRPTAAQIDAAVEIYRNAAKPSPQRVHFICTVCATANGGIWPEGNLATWSADVCEACGRLTSVCGVNDWRWTRGVPEGWINDGWD